MNGSWRLVAGVWCLGLSAALPAGKAWAGDEARPSWDPQAAAKYLDERAAWWLDWSGAARGQGTACVSCHTAVPFALARPALGKLLGEKATGPVEQRLLDGV